MSVVPGANYKKDSSKAQAICPYLGMRTDPQSSVGVPDVRNCCYRIIHPKIVKLTYQEKYCLRRGFQGCEVYIRSGEPPLPLEIFDEEQAGGRPIVFRRITLPWLIRRKKKKAEAKSDALETIPGSIPMVGQDIDLESDDLTWQEETHQRRAGTWWVVAITIILVILLIGAWGTYDRLQNTRRESALAAENIYAGGFATAVQGIGVAADAWGTAIAGQKSPTWTPMIVPTETKQPVNGSVVVTDTPPQVMATPTITGIPEVCQDIRMTSFQIISGPDYKPQVGYKVYEEIAPSFARVFWKVKNVGTCSWSQIFFLSTKNNQIILPSFKRGDEVIKPDERLEKPLVAPGEEITIVLEFPVNKVMNFNMADEWIMMVNGITLFGQPRFVVNANNWIMIIHVTLTPSPRARATERTGNTPRVGPIP